MIRYIFMEIRLTETQLAGLGYLGSSRNPAVTAEEVAVEILGDIGDQSYKQAAEVGARLIVDAFLKADCTRQEEVRTLLNAPAAIFPCKPVSP